MTPSHLMSRLVAPLSALALVVLAAPAKADYCAPVNGCNTCIYDDGGGCCVTYGDCGCYEVNCFAPTARPSTALEARLGQAAAAIFTAPKSTPRGAAEAPCAARASQTPEAAAPVATALAAPSPGAATPAAAPPPGPDCSAVRTMDR
jgi:hypothetical protein